MEMLPNLKFKVSIIGLGALGQALASQIDRCILTGWDVVDTGHVIQTNTLYEAIENADAIFIVVPSEHFHSTLMSIVKEYSKHGDWHKVTRTKFVSFSKGICDGKLPIDIMKSTLPFNPLGVVSGPMLSAELYDQTTHAMLATDNMDVYGVSSILCRMDNLKLHVTSDTVGVTLCGIMKNIYAVGMGMLNGDGTDNLTASYATMALNEMNKVIESSTLLSYAGVGDFIATCYSTSSRNYTYGYRLANQLDTSDLMAEGVKNVDQILQYCDADLPLIQSIKECLNQQDVQPLRAIVSDRTGSVLP